MNARGVIANLRKRAGDAVRIARVLHSSSVGEKLALPADRGLNQAPKEHAERADAPHDESHDDEPGADRRSWVVLSSTRTRKRRTDEAEADVPENTDGHDACDDRGCPRIDARIAVENVAVLVRDDALHLVAREKLHAAARHADHGVRRIGAGGERVDRRIFHHIDGRHRNARRDRHLFDDVEQLSFAWIAR